MQNAKDDDLPIVLRNWGEENQVFFIGQRPHSPDEQISRATATRFGSNTPNGGRQPKIVDLPLPSPPTFDRPIADFI